jgi:hypothetical protein
MKLKKYFLFVSAFDLFAITLLFILLRYFDSFKPAFVISYVLILLPVSYITGKKLVGESGRIFSNLNLKRDMLIILFSSLSLYFMTVFFSGIKLGSVYLTLLISIFSGYFVFAFLKNKVISGANHEAIIKPYGYLLLIFIFALILRFFVFGTSTVPLGYDTPVYLTRALISSEQGFNEVFSGIFKITHNVHKDTWRFSDVWLGLSYRILKFFGLGPEHIAKIIIPFISSLSIIPIFLLSRELANNNRIALFTSLLFAVTPSELVFSGLYKEILGEFFLILSLYLLVSFLKGRSSVTILFFTLSTFLLWKSAVTAFAKFVLFGLGFYVYFLLDKRAKITKNKKIYIIFSMGILSFIFLQKKILTTFPGSSLSPTHTVSDVFMSQRFAFGLVSVIDLVTFVIFFFFLITIYLSKEISQMEKNIFSISIIIFASLFIYAFILSGLGGYRIFPSSSFLNVLRFSLYLSIPFSLVGGLFLNNLLNSSAGRNKVFFILAVLIITFGITGNIHSTPAPGHIVTTISEDTYNELNSINFSAYNGVVVLGEFERKITDQDFSFGNWVNFLVFKNSGKSPLLIGDIRQTNNLSTDNQNYLFINLTGKKISEIRSLDEMLGSTRQ